MGKRKLTDNRRIYLRWKISESRRNIKLKAIEYKGGECSYCGYNKSVSALHFHHLNPSEKDFSLSGMKTRVFDKIKIELDKCVLLCSNCHMEEHEKIRFGKIDGDPGYESYLFRKGIKQKCIEYKGNSCQKCGYSKTITGLCFHHLDTATKLFGITGPAFNKAWEIIKAELDKCILVCGNCHGEIHDEENKNQIKDSYLKVQAAKSKVLHSIIKHCYQCNNIIKVYPSRLKERNFCSRDCRDLVLNVKK